MYNNTIMPIGTYVFNMRNLCFNEYNIQVGGRRYILFINEGYRAIATINFRISTKEYRPTHKKMIFPVYFISYEEHHFYVVVKFFLQQTMFA